MLNLKSRRRGSGTALSAQQTTLSVSWLGNQFRALAVHRGQIEGTWTSPEPVEGVNHFLTLLRRAAAETNFKGTTASLVLAHARLVHQLIEVPPARGAALQKLVSRQAQQQNPFPGEAVWSAQPAESAKATQRLLLNLFPKALLDELLAGSAKAGLFLTTVMPVPALLQSQLTELPNAESEIVVLAAQTGDSTTVLVGRSDGRVLLSRTLAGNWNTNLARMALDLKRTVLFVNQQFGVNVNAVWLFGPNAAEHTAAIQDQVQLPVQPSPTPYTEDYWATEVLRTTVGEAQNLITREQQMAPQRKLAARVLAATVAVILLGSGGVAYYLHRLETAQQQNLRASEREIAALQTKRRGLEDLHADLARRQEMVSVVVEGRNPPLAGWFLAYLSEAVPTDLVVTNLSFQREERAWKLRLGGMLQPSGTNPPPNALAAAVSSLTNRLGSGPFHISFLAPPPPPGTGPAGAGVPSATATNWLSRLGSAPPPPAPKPITVEDSFLIEGLVQP